MCLSPFQVDNMYYIIKITTAIRLIDEETEEIKSWSQNEMTEPGFEPGSLSPGFPLLITM